MINKQERNFFPDIVELNIEEKRKKWVCVLRGVLEKIFNVLGEELPKEISDDEIPALLEKATVARIKEKKEKTRFVVVSASASVGKSTVGKIMENFGLNRLPRITSREKRPDEINGHDYFFLTPEEFEEQKKSGKFLFAKETYGKGRAISKNLFDSALRSGQKFYAEGDALAYHEIIAKYQEYKGIEYQSVFLLPPSFDELLRRMEQVRNKEGDVINSEEIKKRLDQAIYYLEESGNHIVNGVYDGFLVNDELKRVEKKVKEYFL